MKQYYERKRDEFAARYQAALDANQVDEAVKLHAEMLNYESMLKSINA